MKKIILLLAFILHGCVSFPEDTRETTMQRAEWCWLNNPNNYWGECWVERSYLEPTFFEWIEYLQMDAEWELILKWNQILKDSYDAGYMTDQEANQYFYSKLYEVDQVVTYKIQSDVEKARQQRIAWAAALAGVSAQMQANARAYNNTSFGSGFTGFNRGELVDGLNKICFYDTPSGKKSLNVRNVDICPVSYRF
jgi:hypothetical protein